MADVVGMAQWLAERVGEAHVKTGDMAIYIEDGKFAIVVPEDAAVYLVTVEEARFVPAASNQDTKP